MPRVSLHTPTHPSLALDTPTCMQSAHILYTPLPSHMPPQCSRCWKRSTSCCAAGGRRRSATSTTRCEGGQQRFCTCNSLLLLLALNCLYAQFTSTGSTIIRQTHTYTHISQLKDESLFPNAPAVNAAIQDVVSLLRVPRACLGIACSSRGAVAGLVSVRGGPGGAWVDCGALGMAGWAIPGELAAVERLSFRWVLEGKGDVRGHSSRCFQRAAGTAHSVHWGARGGGAAQLQLGVRHFSWVCFAQIQREKQRFKGVACATSSHKLSRANTHTHAQSHRPLHPGG